MNKWGNNIKMDLKWIWCEDLDWIRLARGRVKWHAFVNTVMNIWVP